jgi:hypothetical protein
MALLPVARAGDVFSRLRDYRDEMNRYREEFSSEYANILNRLRDRLGAEMYGRAARKLPEPGAIRGKFGMVWAIIPLGGGNHVDIADLRGISDELDSIVTHPDTDVLTAEIVSEIRQRLNTVITDANRTVNRIDDLGADEMIREARAQMQSFASDFIDRMAQEPRQQLQEAVDNLITSIRKGRRIQTGTIGQIRTAFELVRGFRFLADGELLRRIDSLDAQLAVVTPQQLNSDRETSANLTVALRHVSQQAANAKAASVAIRNFRGVNLGRSRRRRSRGGGAAEDEPEPAAALV